MLQVLEEQMARHISGEKKLPDDRLSSLTKRINIYEDQLIEASRDLSDEVCSIMREVLCISYIQQNHLTSNVHAL